MSGGGGNQTTVQKSDPPAYAQPFLTDILQTAYRNSQSPPAYYPGQTFVGPTQGQLDAFGQQFDYQNSVFGGQAAPKFGEATGALSQNLTGSNGLGQLGSGFNPLALNSLQQGFNAPQGTALGYNTSGAFNRALSGQPDYASLQGSIDAANAPILRQFNEQILPELNSRAAFLGNPTGGIKSVNRILPQLGQQLGENALRATEGERQRALAEQTQAAQFLTGAQENYRGQALGLGQLASGVQSNITGNQLQGIGQFGQLFQAGQQPGQLSGQFADFGRQFQDQALQDQIARFNYYQNLPNQTLGNLANVVYPGAGFGGVQTASGPGGSPLAGALGGALTGASIGGLFGAGGGAAAGAASGAATGSVVPGFGTLIGAGIGALGGYFASR
jgi:hypothetical protein